MYCKDCKDCTKRIYCVPIFFFAKKTLANYLSICGLSRTEGERSKLSGNKKLFLFLPPGNACCVDSTLRGRKENSAPGFVFAQQSRNFCSQNFHVWFVSKYLNIFSQILANCFACEVVLHIVHYHNHHHRH